MNIDQGRESQARVLIADDDDAIRMLVSESLQLAGFDVLEAENGSVAVELFAQHRPDVVLLDVMMPGMDGFDTCRELRQLPGGDGVPVLMMTGLDDVDSISRAYEAGATDFAGKPINFLILSHRVRYMLRARQMTEELRESKARLDWAQQVARLGHWELDVEGGNLLWSGEVYTLFGLNPKKFQPTYDGFLERVHSDDRELVKGAVEQALNHKGSYSVDHRILLPNNSVRHVHEQGQVLTDEDGKPVRMTGTVQDITARKEAEDKIRHLAYYDSLTQLPNRMLFNDRLMQAVSMAKRHERKLAILFIDLDRFKHVNDTLGHSKGDKLLQAVAGIFSECVREGDTVTHFETEMYGNTVARLGGDEFVISLADINRPEDAATVAQRILEALAKPIKLDNHEVFVSASIGISIYPNDGEDAEALFMHADTAMYHAKDAGKNNYQFFIPSMNAAAHGRMSMESNLHKALERKEFVLHYQPQVDSGNERIVGMEALIRWNHPELGLVPPATFIPLAEETGLIAQIGDWVMRQACKHAKTCDEAGLEPLRVSVNLSGHQFREKRLVGLVGDALQEADLEPGRLELEITESVAMEHAEQTVRTLHELKAMGVRVSIDDFGTGYSSLSYLKRFPIDSLKVDRSFIKDITIDSDDAAITRAIIAMAKSLRLEVVAEGVETAEQLNFLRLEGCELIQGYLFSKPLPADHFIMLMNTHDVNGRRLGNAE